MTRSIFSLTLALRLYYAAVGDIGAAEPEIVGRSVEAEPPNAIQVRQRTIASNRSNAREIYTMLLNAAGKPAECHEVSVVADGFRNEELACSVSGVVDQLRLTINNFVVHWHDEIVRVQGPTKCWQEWQAEPGRRPRGYSLWYFCRFNEISQ